MNAVAAKNESLFDATLKVAIIYDDFDLGALATALLERVTIPSDTFVRWDIKPWRLDVVKHPPLAAVTVAVAADAELIVFALRGTSLPTEALMGWLNNWATHRQIEDAALLVLCADKNAAATPLQNELEKFANTRGLTFLGSYDAWDNEDSLHFIQRLRQRERFLAETFPFYAESPPATRHWGINE